MENYLAPNNGQTDVCGHNLLLWLLFIFAIICPTEILIHVQRDMNKDDHCKLIYNTQKTQEANETKINGQTV